MDDYGYFNLHEYIGFDKNICRMSHKTLDLMMQSIPIPDKNVDVGEIINKKGEKYDLTDEML